MDFIEKSFTLLRNKMRKFLRNLINETLFSGRDEARTDGVRRVQVVNTCNSTMGLLVVPTQGDCHTNILISQLVRRFINIKLPL